MVNKRHQAIKTDGICTTLSASMGMGGGYVPMHNYDYRIRKLTPKESLFQPVVYIYWVECYYYLLIVFGFTSKSNV